MKLKELTKNIDVWYNWVNAYKKYVPKFIEEASTKTTWKEWDQDVFREYFEKSNDQCVSSLKQGYFTNEEKNKIKKNWSAIAPLLKRIADNQEAPQWETYEELKQTIRKYTKNDMRSATNRLIAGLQPKLLSTVVKEESLRSLYDYLKETIEEEIQPYQHNWFKDSHTIATLFQKSHPSDNPMDLISYPWQVYDFSKNSNLISPMKNQEIQKYIDLLNTKKQIILQGPPGTGKTRLAKQIAIELIKNNRKENYYDLFNILKEGSTIANASGKKDYYTITKIDHATVSLQSKNSLVWSPRKEHILFKYEQLLKGETPKNVNGKDPYELALAKYLFENKNKTTPYSKDEYCKTIQFHPSYTYEDFVRGITIKNNGEGLEYITENKVLASIAEKALKNWNNHHKEITIFNKETQLDKYFSLFIDLVEEKIEQNEGTLPLTENVALINLDEDAFRYKGKGEGWVKNGNRMLFKDIKQAFLDDNRERQDLKKNPNLSGLAKQHASYFVRVLNQFQTFLKEHDLSFDKVMIEKEPLKNYVLIIDEINRANLSSVLGELIYALEYRGESVESMYAMENGDREITLPPNLFIIGTMNTADRSVAQIDYAIRRRFAFINVLPEDLTGKLDKHEFATDSFKKVQDIFNHHISSEFNKNDVQLGHSYFIYDKESNFSIQKDFEIKPILHEYIKDGILEDNGELTEKIEQL
ncbi:5-methylcytosine-specific restriction endonuclease McrBC, GTP-binding regulatory subunit McrB [Tenacibaculum sp. 190130A14a]|uniref:5-methylcytosine-specific restriction enzyme B n=1 Tax=Tenacibaculum polynesiense TaxID=3137857 RepID=A0ABP1F755_9FLAO